MSLYRKHRPQQFNDIVGQDHIKTTLSNALISGKFSHAYIFAGPKGSGKTTMARILAKALNCVGRDLKNDFEPCDKCISCLEVTSGHSMDVVEIDAASNRGIDEIRDLREKIKFAPTAGRFKVYVIDECHMLTKEAFNALLKTLEEPPAHAVFVLATTELHKVPATILSRAQLFDFKKGKTDEVVGLLNEIVKREKIQIDPQAIQLIARLAYGAYRDALTLLDQVAAVRNDNKSITLQETQLVLGQATEQSVWDFVDRLLENDRNQALKIINDVYSDGKDLANFVGEVIELLRKIILAQVGLGTQFEGTEDEKKQINKFAKLIDDKKLISLIQKMVFVLPQVKVSVLGQLPLEMLVVEFVGDEQVESRKSKVENVKEEEPKKEPKAPTSDESESRPESVGKETKIEKIIPDSKPVILSDSKKTIEEEKVISNSLSVISKEKNNESQETNNELLVTNNSFSGSLASSWSEVVKILRNHNHAIAAMLRDAAVREETEDTLILGVKYKFQADQICNVKIRPLIEAAITEISGKTLKISCIVDESIKIEKPVEHEEVLLNDAKDIFESE